MKAIGILVVIAIALAGTGYVMDTSSVLVGWLLGVGSVAFYYYMTTEEREND